MEKSVKKNVIVEIILISLVSASLIFVMFTKGWEIDEAEGYTKKLDVIVNKNSEFTWNVEPLVDVKSVKLGGVVSKLGVAKAFIENNDNRYLILDSSILIEGIAATGLAVVNGTYKEAEFPSLISFEDICIETCSLNGFDKNSYNLIFEISGGAILSIKSIDYARAEEPEASAEPSTIKRVAKTPWLPLVLIPIILNIGLVLYIKSRKKNNIPIEFKEKLRQIDYFSNKDLKKAINAYNKVRSMYAELAGSEINQKVKARAYKAIEKSYGKLRKISQNKL